MASDRARNVADMFVAVIAFDAVHKTEYVAITAAAAEIAKVKAASDAMEAFFAEQTSGEASMAVEQKSLLKIAARRRMKAYAKTARALRLSNPGIEKVFEVPTHDSDVEIVAKGRDMVTQAGKYHVELASLGIAATVATELTGILDQIEAASTDKAAANASTVGATAGIDNEVDNGMAAATVLDAIMHNFYGDDPVTLAEWTTARHVKRAPQAKAAGDPPTL